MKRGLVMSDSVVWIERGKKGTTVTRVDYRANRSTVLSKPEKPSIKRGMVSFSNGVVGGASALTDAMAKDRALGVADCIEYKPFGAGGYSANYSDVSSFDRWMHAHKRVNHNAGCGTPCPGDFRGQVPKEYE